MDEFLTRQYAYFRDRLTNLMLLEKAVEIKFKSHSDLAVPTGGTRRGGYLTCCDIRDARKAFFILEGRSGFPHLRIDYSPYRDACHSVEWGDLPPDGTEETGRFYGYREDVLYRD